jgi:Uma2 family endonuclease
MQDLNESDQVQVDFSRRYTLEEFLALPRPEDGSRYELIDGYLYVIPPPDPIHEQLAARMAKALTRFLEDNKIDGEVHVPPEAIYGRTEGSTDSEPD